MKKMSLKSRLLTGALLTVSLSLGTVGVANAATTNIGGELNTAGFLVQYNHTRVHQFNGAISLNVTDMPYGYLRLGLRNMKVKGGPQFTDTLMWTSKKGGKQQWSNILKGTLFAFQGRMPPGSNGLDNRWGGTLTY